MQNTRQFLSLFCICILMLSVTSFFPRMIPKAEGLIKDKKEISTLANSDFLEKI